MNIIHLITITLPKVTRSMIIGFAFITTYCYSMEKMGFQYILSNEIREPVIRYMETLPKIIATPDDSDDTKAEAIVNLFSEMIPQRNGQKKLPLQGQTDLKARIKNCIDNAKPIKMITIGFPFKSSNHELKVIDEKIDMGDFIGLLTYEYVCQEIKKIHTPGGQLILHSDGFVYRDLDILNSFTLYQDNLKKLAIIFPSIIIANTPDMTIIDQQPINQVDPQTKRDIGFFMETELHCNIWKKVLLQEHIHIIKIESCVDTKGKSDIELRINDDLIKFRILVNQTHHLTEIKNGNTLNFIDQYLDKNSQLKNIKPLVIFMNKLINDAINKKREALADFAANASGQFSSAVKGVTNDYPDFIRLSVHPHTNINEKCGMSLVFGSTATPWHACPILGSHGIKIMAKADFFKQHKIKQLEINPLLKSTIINGVSLKYINYDLK